MLLCVVGGEWRGEVVGVGVLCACGACLGCCGLVVVLSALIVVSGCCGIVC